MIQALYLDGEKRGDAPLPQLALSSVTDVKFVNARICRRGHALSFQYFGEDADKSTQKACFALETPQHLVITTRMPLY